MRDRGKAVESSTNVLLSDAFSSDPPCRKHPSSSVGICAYCLKDRLIKLVCSDCGEQRLSSCSCSDISSNRNSCSVEVGSVGRISFLIENEKTEGAEPGNHSKQSSNSRKSFEKVDSATAVLLKRNSSSSVYEKRRAFWHVGWIFKKKKEMGSSAFGGRNSSVEGEKGEMLPSDHLGLSGSNSVVGFDELEGGFSGKNRSFPVPSSVNGDGFAETDRGFHVEMRTSFGGSGLDCEKESSLIDMKAGLSSEPKRGFSGFKNGGFVDQEAGFLGEKDAGFIDLEVDFLSKSKGDFSGLKVASCVDSEVNDSISNVKIGGLSALGRFGSLRCGLLEHETDLKVGGFSSSSFQKNGLGGLRCCSLDHEPGSLGHFRSSDTLSNASSCRITVNDCEIRGGKKSLKVWKWIFKNSRGRSGRK